MRAPFMLVTLLGVTAMAAGLGYVAMHPLPVVLMFHSVVPAPEGQDVSPAALGTILKAARAARRPVLFTTDSSDQSVADAFAPQVSAGSFPALLFLMPPAVDRPGMLSWDQIRALDQRGWVVGSHTLTHPWLPELTDAEVRCEVCGSKAWIETELGHPIRVFAYPYGAFDDRVRRMLTECGYAEAYATAPGRRVADEDPFARKRVTVTQSTAENPLLRWLALSGYWVTARETLLFFVPLTIPRKPSDWSYADWHAKEKPIPHASLFCP